MGVISIQDILLQLMSDLDLSHHSLNNSASKNKFTFPKTQRFASKDQALCDSYYQIPTTISHRATSFGYGEKKMCDVAITNVPAAGTYKLKGQFEAAENRGCSFGVGREKMQLGGPMKDAKVLKFVPGPGNYEFKPAIDPRGPALRSRLPDYSTKHLANNPGPGAYGFEQFGSKMYYLVSKHANDTNRKMSTSVRLEPMKHRIAVGPADYTVGEETNPKGRYSLSNHQNVKAGLFGKSVRENIVSKERASQPGPGQYKTSFTSFGQI